LSKSERKYHEFIGYEIIWLTEHRLSGDPLRATYAVLEMSEAQ
jgi:hypothetical protein